MALAFHKMHGLSNDFVVIDARAEGVGMTEAQARAIADRRTGIGCDQVILIEPSEQADARMRIFNANGGEVEACGNAARCVALLLGGETTIETLGGRLDLDAHGEGATVAMPTPRFDWDAIPLAYPMDTAHMPVAWEDLADPTAVNVGNPHIIFFVPHCATVDLAALGPIIENDVLFPDKINVNVATVTGNDVIRLRVWERGAGLTRACGTGACATAVAAIRRGLVASLVTVSLPGGDLQVAWTPGEGIRMSGPAAHVFKGEIELERFG